MKPNFPNFLLNSEGEYSSVFIALGLVDFQAACRLVQQLEIDKQLDCIDFTTILSAKKGTNATKHALLAKLAEEQFDDHLTAEDTVEMMVGIYLMSVDSDPKLSSYFQGKAFSSIPETYCFLRYKGQRFDFTDNSNHITSIETRIVREQRIDPHQIGEWKEMIHREYLGKWLGRHKEIALTLDELWHELQICRRLISN